MVLFMIQAKEVAIIGPASSSYMRLSLCCNVLYLFEPAFELPAVVCVNSE